MARDGDPTSGITLEAAPEHFFDQERWDEFASGCGSREKALQQISHPDPEHFAWYRCQIAEQQTPLGAKAREAERTHRSGERLVRDFRARLISGEYVATGFQPPSIERVRIPAELHSGLDFDFENGTEKGDGYTFSHILIIQSCGSVGNGFEVSERIAAWLIERRAGQGEELKKALLHAARTEFGSEFRSRAIDAAYYRIYARARGRPRSTRG